MQKKFFLLTIALLASVNLVQAMNDREETQSSTSSVLSTSTQPFSETTRTEKYSSANSPEPKKCDLSFIERAGSTAYNYTTLATASLWAAKSLQALPTIKSLTALALVDAPTKLVGSLSYVGGYASFPVTKVTGLATQVSAPVMGAAVSYAGCITPTLLLLKSMWDCYREKEDDKHDFYDRHENTFTYCPDIVKLFVAKFCNNVVNVTNAAVNVAPYVGGALLAGLVLKAAQNK